MITMELSKEEVVDLDVSFITKYLNKLYKMPLEIKIIEFYHLRSMNNTDTIRLFKDYLYEKLKVKDDTELFRIVRKNSFNKLVFKIKATMDALVYEKFGCEVMDAKFVSFNKATTEEVSIKMEIKR